MMKYTYVVLPLLVTLAIGLTLASDGNPSTTTKSQAAETRTRPTESTKHILAKVNGIPIGNADVLFALKKIGDRNKTVTSEHMKNILEVIIQRELISQRAVELGLDANPAYQEKLRRMEAQVDAFKREELANLFWREIDAKVVITEEEGRKYFTQNISRIRTELHVWQILLRNENLIEQTRKELEHGTSFEEVARKQFPNLPKSAGAPWDLGYMKWKQVPESWQDVIDHLKKGEVSGVIRGPNHRFWIIKLIDKRENPDITYDSFKPTIMEALKAERLEKIRKKTEQNLQTTARIEYLNDPVPEVEE